MGIEETTSIPIRQDRATVLMGDTATLQGAMNSVPADHGTKRYPVTGWNSPQDSFGWEPCANEWFIDGGCVYYPLNPPFGTMAHAAKAGNAERVICYDPWIWPRFTDFRDYFCRESYRWLKITEDLPQDGTGIFTKGPQRGLQAPTNFILEGSWLHNRPKTPVLPPTVDGRTFVNDM